MDYLTPLASYITVMRPSFFLMKLITSKKARCAYIQSTGTTEHITMLCGASAAGAALSLMIIYPKTFPGGQYRVRGPNNALYACSESGG